MSEPIEEDFGDEAAYRAADAEVEMEAEDADEANFQAFYDAHLAGTDYYGNEVEPVNPGLGYNPNPNPAEPEPPAQEVQEDLSGIRGFIGSLADAHVDKNAGHVPFEAFANPEHDDRYEGAPQRECTNGECGNPQRHAPHPFADHNSVHAKMGGSHRHSHEE